MMITVETPKHSFFKYRFKNKKFFREFFSPIPCIVNYGFIEGTRGEDGSPIDVIILGRKLLQGERIDLKIEGVVKFIDDGVRDDKYIAVLDEKRSNWRIILFFNFYMIFKKIYFLIKEKRRLECKFEGITWFDEPVESLEKLAV
ncbi:MAG: inorganic diphosphatase [Candidatus Hydrothermarchaeota archaeon]